MVMAGACLKFMRLKAFLVPENPNDEQKVNFCHYETGTAFDRQLGYYGVVICCYTVESVPL